MKIIRGMELHNESREEKLPDFAPDFPYIASRVELDYFRESSAPWHWHRAVELFYIESGELKYRTPNAVEVFQAGSGGLINSNVLHMTEFQRYGGRNIQLIHLFEPSLIAGPHDGLIDRKYVVPLLTSRLEMIVLHPEEPEQADILRLIRQAFELTDEDFGYELLLREALARIWLKLLHLSASALQEQPRSSDRSTEQIKRMLTYIHEHFSEKNLRQRSGRLRFSERKRVLPGLSDLPAHDPCRISAQLPPAAGVPDAGGREGAGNRRRLCLRTWKSQLFRKMLSFPHRLHAAGIPQEMAES